MLLLFRLPPANWPYYSGSLSLPPSHLTLCFLLSFFCWPHLTAPSALWRDCDAGQRIRFRSLLSYHVGRRTQSHSGWNTHRHRAARETRVRAGATGAAAAERDTRLHSRRGKVSVSGPTRWSMSKEAFPLCRSSAALCWKWLMPVSELVDRPPPRPPVSTSCTCSATQMSPYSLPTLLTLRRSRPRWRPVTWWRRSTISSAVSIK